MLKAADSLAAAGYQVRVVSAWFLPWAVETDRQVRLARDGAWTWSVVDYRRRHAPAAWLRTGLRFRIFRRMATLLGAARCPLALAAGAWGRIHPELVRSALAEPADLFYGGGAAVAAVAQAGRLTDIPYAIDLEDFHTAEREDSAEARLAHALAGRIEEIVLPGAAFITAAGSAMAAAYAETYGVRPICINNTFPCPRKAPRLVPNVGDGLKLYWFSQTIGPRRGLEDVVRAMGLAGIGGELHLRGLPVPGYVEGLTRLAADVAPRLEVIQHDPAPPDAMVELCEGYDAGLALEQGHVRNRELCLSNKAFTYMLAGLAVVLTDTQGQRPLAVDLGEGALVYSPGDVDALAKGLSRWAHERPLLARARHTAWEAGRRRWHWEHPEERGMLLQACAMALGPRVSCAS